MIEIGGCKHETRPSTFRVEVPGPTVDLGNIEVEVFDQFGETFLTPESSEKIEAVKREYLSKRGNHKLRARCPRCFCILIGNVCATCGAVKNPVYLTPSDIAAMREAGSADPEPSGHKRVNFRPCWSEGGLVLVLSDRFGENKIEFRIDARGKVPTLPLEDAFLEALARKLESLVSFDALGCYYSVTVHGLSAACSEEKIEPDDADSSSPVSVFRTEYAISLTIHGVGDYDVGFAVENK